MRGVNGKGDGKNGARAYVGFRLGSAEYAIPIAQVREIVRTPSLARMPLGPPGVAGVADLRGRLVPVVDLRGPDSPAAGEAAQDGRVIVAEGAAAAFGLLVDAVTGILSIDEAAVEPAAALGACTLRGVVGAALVEGRPVTLFDAADLVGPKREGSSGGAMEAGCGGPDGPASEEFLDARDLLKRRCKGGDPRGTVIADLLAFLEAAAAKDFERAEALVERLAQSSADDLYRHVGKVTRRLHESLKSFKESLDPRIRSMASVEMPRAVDSLRFVVSKTEEAANKTMEIVEKYLFRLDEFSTVLREVKEPPAAVAYFKAFRNELEDDLTAVITAQSFQDITGQAIGRVIGLVEDLERELVGLVARFGIGGPSAEEAVAAAGGDTVSQSDVDRLLAEFEC